MSLTLPSEGQSNWDEPLNEALTSLDTRVDAAQADADTAAAAAQSALSRENHTGTQSADTITDGATNKVFTATEKTKLAGIATEATANSSDAALRARASHTGTQTASTISDFDAAVDARISSASPREVAFSVSGDVATATGAHRIYNDSGVARTIIAVRASVGTAPTGASLIVDVNKNGTTIFTTQSNRPTIAASGNTDKADAIEVASWADGAYLTVDIDQVGSTIAGADLTVTVTYR